MATTSTSSRDLLATRLGSNGLLNLARIYVAASNTKVNLTKISEVDRTQHGSSSRTQSGVLSSDMHMISGAILEECSGITNAYKAFHQAEDYLSTVLYLSEIVCQNCPVSLPDKVADYVDRRFGSRMFPETADHL